MKILSKTTLSALLALAGCGYNFQGSGTSLPDDVKTVAIAKVENNTIERGLGTQVEESLRSVFERYGALKVVEEENQADAVLQAKILGITTAVKSVTSSTDVALEYNLTMYIAAELKRSNGQILWLHPKLSASEPFASTSDVVVTSSSDFAQGGIGGDTLSGLESNEVARGQQKVALNEVVDEISRKLYLEAVAEEF